MTKSFQVRSVDGDDYEVTVDGDQRILNISGAWPGDDDAEVVFEEGFPPHSPPTEFPEHVQTFARDRALTVCYYDPDGCRTCYCDDNGRMRCVKMC